MSTFSGKPKPTKPGSNWKKLQKTLTPSEASTSLSASTAPHKKQRLSSSTHSLSRSTSLSSLKDKGKARALDALASPTGTGSPAPTSLPWFAEDLSPDDLALVKSGHDVQGAAESLPAATPAEERRKKEIILGGRDELVGPEKRDPGTYLAIDCEMVGVGPHGSESMLARVSLVNWHGYCVLDTFVRPMEKVTDYRTWVSGVRASDLKGAPTFSDVQKQVASLIKGRVLIGHAVQNDLKALLLSHPLPLLRDTATFKPLRELAKTKFPALRNLARLVLGITIQREGEEHSSVEDAQATMAIYRTQHAAWQKALGRKGREGRGSVKGRKSDAQTGEGEEEASEGAARKTSRGTKRASSEANGGAERKRKVVAAPEWWKEE